MIWPELVRCGRRREADPVALIRLRGVGGRDVVMLHGQPGAGSDWQQLADKLPAGLRVVALDRPGYGANPVAAGGFAVGARSVVAELDARGIERAEQTYHNFVGQRR